MNPKRIPLIILCAILTLSALTSCAAPTPDRPLTAAELLDFGERYLLELNFTQALVNFLAVIDIEPMNPRGYTGAAEAYIGLGQVDEAIAVLILGQERLPDNVEIRGMIDGLLPQEPEPTPAAEEPVEQIEEETEEYEEYHEPDLTEVILLAERVLELYNSGGSEAVAALIISAEFIATLSPIINEAEGQQIVFPDIGVGFYNIWGVYIGEFAGLDRSGFGTWIGSSWVFTGSWAGDMPNGEGVLRRYHDYGHSDLIGTFVNGMGEGAMVQQEFSYHEDARCNHTLNLTADNGYAVAIGTKDSGFVYSAVCNGYGCTFAIGTGRFLVVNGFW